VTPAHSFQPDGKWTAFPSSRGNAAFQLIGQARRVRRRDADGMDELTPNPIRVQPGSAANGNGA
jgi:hypothetical protein